MRRSWMQRNPRWVRQARVVVLAPLVACFGDLTIPPCDSLSDCPAGYLSCRHSYCFLWNTGCETASPASGDGCCTGWEVDRTGDRDCRTFDLDLEASALSPPAVRPRDGMVFLMALSLRDGRGHLVQVSSRGELLWDLPQGAAQDLLPPVMQDDRIVLCPLAAGISVVDTDRREVVDLLPSPAPPTLPLAASEEAVAWVDQENTVHIFHRPKGQRVALDGVEDGIPPVYSRRAGRFMVVAPGGRLLGIRPDALPDREPVTESLDLGAPVRTPLAIAGDRTFLVTEAGVLHAIGLYPGAWQQAWQVSLGSPSHFPILVDSEGRIFVLRDDGLLFVVREMEGKGTVVSSTDLGTGVEPLSLGLVGNGRLMHVREGRLRTHRLQGPETGGVLTEGWSHSLNGQRGLPAVVERRVVVALENGHLWGLVSWDEADPGPWTRPGGDGANRDQNPR